MNTGVGCQGPTPGDLPNPGIQPLCLKSPLAGRFFTTSTIWEAHLWAGEWGSWGWHLRIRGTQMKGTLPFHWKKSFCNFSHLYYNYCYGSVSQSCPTLQHHGLQHTRLYCPSQSPGACSNSCPLSWWCHPTISSSIFPFSSCFQSFPISGSFLMSQLPIQNILK